MEWWQKLLIMFIKLWHYQIIWYLFAGCKSIILFSVHSSIWFMKYLFSAYIYLVETSTRIVKDKLQVAKSNHGILVIPCIFLNLLLIQIHSFPVEKNFKNVMRFARKLSWESWELQGVFSKVLSTLVMYFLCFLLVFGTQKWPEQARLQELLASTESCSGKR